MMKIEITRECNKFFFKLAMASEIRQCLMVSTTQVYETPKTREPVREEDDIKITNKLRKVEIWSLKWRWLMPSGELGMHHWLS